MQTVLVFAQIAIPVLLAIGGLWLRHVVKQQLSLKDAEIQALKTEKDRLEALTAPAITSEHKAMKEFADEMARRKQEIEKTMNQVKEEAEKEKQEMQERLANLEAGENSSEEWVRRMEEFGSAKQSYAAYALLSEASAATLLMLHNLVGKPEEIEQIVPDATVRVLVIAQELMERFDGIRKVGNELVNDKEPTFPNSSLYESLVKGDH